MSKFVIAYLTIFSYIAGQCLACNNYKLSIKKLENCAGDDAILKIEDGFNVELTNDCKVVINGCAAFKSFASGTAKYKVKKGAMTLKEGTEDICASASKAPAHAKEMLKGLGAPESCPVEEGRSCASGVSIDISKYKSMIGFAKGTTEAEITIDHDTGKSCLNVVVEITK